MKQLLRRSAVVLALCWLTTPAWADDVLYKCIDAKGAVSIQSAPCPVGSRQAWKRDAAASPSMPAATAPGTPPGAPPVRPAGPAVAAPPPLAQVPPAEVAAPPPMADPCAHAQDVAAQLRDMPWLELTDEQQHRLLGWLMQQCRPAPAPGQP